MKETSEKTSQLIEVVWASNVRIVADRDFITFVDVTITKNHHWNISDTGAIPDATRRDNNFTL